MLGPVRTLVVGRRSCQKTVSASHIQSVSGSLSLTVENMAKGLSGVGTSDAIYSTDFSYIAFASASNGAAGPIEAHLRSVQGDSVPQSFKSEDALDVHIIASRSYACFPPVENMEINLLANTAPSIFVNNSRGVTVHDVQFGVARRYGVMSWCEAAQCLATVR